MATEIRRARPDDIGLLLDLGAEYCAADGHHFDAAVARAGFEPLLADDAHGMVWLIDPDSTSGADGYVVVTWGWSVEIGGREAVLDEIYVRTRGEGRGGDALRHVEQACRAHGVLRIFLETERANDGARRLYARHGYAVEDSIWMSRELR